MKCELANILRAVAVMGVGGGVSLSAEATTLTFDMSVEFSGAADPAGPAPWLSATLDDGDTPGSVELTLDNTNLVGGEFVDAWYLNLDPGFDPLDLSFSAPTKAGAFADPTISLRGPGDGNGFKADGDGRYDILIDFAQSGPNRFGVGESVTFTLTGIPGLTVDSFDFLSAPDGGNGPFVAAAHVQGIVDTGDGDSGWVTVPEPGSLALLALGAGALLARRR